ncbi:MAG: hypothetical protein K8T26_00570 [Lentisphaerae bacterium]|nr:hypothetical protein [Lentisphaerota bacterium]
MRGALLTVVLLAMTPRLLAQTPMTPAPSNAPTVAGLAPEPRSRTGPLPPPGVAPKSPAAPLPREPAPLATTILLDVPAFAYHHGCGPTSLAMALAYYDTRGYPDLFDGDATNQTEDVSQAIASSRNVHKPAHYQDYCLPLDYDGRVLPDKSEPPAGDEHPPDSIADFARTSWSAAGNCYGWTLARDIADACTSYVRWRQPAYTVTCAHLHMADGTLTWGVLTREIDAGRPMVFLTDSDADGEDDHFVTVVGYRTTPASQYGCLDTWPPIDVIRWCDMAAMRKDQPWGVSHAWTIHFAPRQTPATFSNVALDTNLLVFTVTGLCFGATQHLEVATHLALGAWSNACTFTPRTALTNLTVPTPPDTRPRFYRLRGN